MSSIIGSPMKDLRGYLKPEEVYKILNTAKKVSMRDFLLIRLLWVTGARISEILNLKTEDIVWDDNSLILITLKRKKKNIEYRRVPVDKRTMEYLKTFITKYNIKGRIFPITRQRAFQIIRKIGKLAGITKVGEKKLHPHHFRHSHCVMWVRNNNTLEGLRKLQQRLKHANISTTAHYLQFAVEETKKEVEEVFGRW